MRFLAPRYLAALLFVISGSVALFVLASNSPLTPPPASSSHSSGNCSSSKGGCCRNPGVGSSCCEQLPTHGEEFCFHHNHVIGTSLDVWVTAPDEAAADLAEQTILGEIERLRRIFSTYDAGSEISQLNRTPAPVPVSAEMIEVLRRYEVWQERSRGAFSGQLGELVRIWQEAEKTQQEPTAETLSRIVFQISRPGWKIDDTNNTVVRLTDQPLNLNSIAKGYIIGKAAALARTRVPSMTGLLLNLGGDMAGWGKDELGRIGWNVGVQDPHRPEDNAPVLARFRLQDWAVATSGGYQRFYTIQGQRHSHIFDPRTGRSANGPASATVVADDNVTANALATTLCVLSPEEGLSLIAATPGTECLLVTADGRQVRSPGFAALELPAQDKTDKKEPADKKAPADKKDDKKAWPDGFQVNLSLTLPVVQSNRYRKPYVAVWVAGADAKPVRTVTVWGNNNKYFKDLPEWWKFARNDNALVKAVTRATRPPGKYQLVWDGKDDKGNALPQGTYTVFVEVHREHGKLVRQSGKIVCGPETASITLEANAETGATIIEYAAKKKSS